MRKELALILFLVLVITGCSKSENPEDVRAKEMQKKIEDSFDESNRILNENTKKTIEALDRASTNENVQPQIQ